MRDWIGSLMELNWIHYIHTFILSLLFITSIRRPTRKGLGIQEMNCIHNNWNKGEFLHFQIWGFYTFEKLGEQLQCRRVPTRKESNHSDHSQYKVIQIVLPWYHIFKRLKILLKLPRNAYYTIYTLWITRFINHFLLLFKKR